MKKWVWFGRLGFEGLVWYIWLDRFGLTGLIWQIWVGLVILGLS